MASLFRGISKFLSIGKGSVAFLLAVFFSLSLLNSNNENRQGVIDTLVSTVLYPLEFSFSLIDKIESLAAQNEILKLENARLKIMNDFLIQDGKENLRLNQLVGFKEKSTFPLQIARVIARNPGRAQTNIVINRGLSDSVGLNMPVMTINGLVGRISKVYEHHSHVKLLFNPTVNVSVIENNSRSIGIMETPDGQNPRVELYKYADVKVGDTIVTSGFGGIFPKGMPIGTISAFSKNEIDVMQYAEISLFQDPSILEEVFIIQRQSRWSYFLDDEKP